MKIGGGGRRSVQVVPDCVIPAWSAGIQVNMDVCGSILASLDAGYRCRHDVAVLLATIQHVTTMHKLRAQYVDVPYSLAAVVALLVSVLGIIALIAVFFRQ